MRRVVCIVIATLPLAVPLASVPGVAAEETRKLPVTADVGICAHRQEVHHNTGGAARVRIKGNEHYYLFAFDAKPIANWRIARATLHLKLASGDLRRAATCTVPAAWTEGTSRRQPQTGSTCFSHLRYADAAWTPAGGTMLDATFNSPHMMWRVSEIRTDGAWLKIPIAGELIEAVACGLSHGLVVGEERGQTRENHDVFTREQRDARPYLTVTGSPAPEAPKPTGKFTAEAFAPAAGLNSGAIRVVPPQASAGTGGKVPGARIDLFPAGGGDRAPIRQFVTFGRAEVIFSGLKPGAAHTVRVQTFAAPGSFVERSQPVRSSAALAVPKVPRLARAEDLTLGVKAEAGWRLRLHRATAKVRPDATGDDRPAQRVSVPVTARNAWVGLQAAIFPPGGAATDVTVELPALAYRGEQDEAVPPLKPVRLFRVWAVRRKGRPHAEVLVPLRPGEKLTVPWKLNALPRQRCQCVFLDIWVPRSATPGPYAGALVVRRAGKQVASAPIRLRVAPAVLSDRFHVAGDMNAYSSPAGAMGLGTSDPSALLAMERRYYRLAHAHRMTLNVLPYSQSGGIRWRSAPRIAGRGGACRVADWRQWDQRYGPLLSGEAFSAAEGYVGPGAGVPVRHMYLPLHENWPAGLAEHFRPWPPPRDYQAFLKWAGRLPPIEKSLARDAADAWQAVLRQFAEHLRRRKWTRTRCQVYLNNKYYFRRDGGRGISLWLLDEPMFADDFLALAYYGRLTRRAAGAAGARDLIRYRIDISRPTHQRTWLDGAVDLNVCADQLHSQRHLIADRRRRLGEEYWNYRMPPSFAADNLAWAVWPIRSYCWGAVGTLPWQTIGSDADLEQADETALMYPGRKFGLDGPVASLRMKAWRTGLQDAELLRQLAAKRRWTDVQLRAWVGAACGLSGWQDGGDPAADAAIVTFAPLTAEGLEQLRRAALAALAGASAGPGQ